jgi:hypothetical protein
MNIRNRTTYERATDGYDDAFEAQLVEAIITAIAQVSLVSDANAVVVRTGETAQALLTVLAGMLAMSPDVMRSRTAIRKLVDQLHKKLRRRTAAAGADPDLQEFLRRVFRGTDVAGRA